MASSWRSRWPFPVGLKSSLFPFPVGMACGRFPSTAATGPAGVAMARSFISFLPGRIYRLGMVGYDVTPDGRRFLLNAAADENNRPLTLLVNWQEELKKK